MLAPYVTTCAADAAPCPWNRMEAHYGDGWFSGLLGGHLVIDHGGDINGFTTMNAFMPHDGITIVLLSNQANSGASSFLGLALVQIMLVFVKVKVVHTHIWYRWRSPETLVTFGLGGSPSGRKGDRSACWPTSIRVFSGHWRLRHRYHFWCTGTTTHPGPL